MDRALPRRGLNRAPNETRPLPSVELDQGAAEQGTLAQVVALLEPRLGDQRRS